MKFILPAQHNHGERWRKGESPSSSQPMQKRSRLREWCRQLFLWFCLIFFSLVSYCICQQFIVSSVVIQGKSMLPTLQEGDHCLLDRWTYRHRDPQRGDLVVLRDPGHSDFAVKRIIALPGESIAFSKGKVYVNNVLLPEPYIMPDRKTVLPKGKDKVIALKQDEYFVMGDNRSVSEDSRCYGPISRDRIAGNLALK